MIRINLLPPEDRIQKREFKLPEMSNIYPVAGVVLFIAAMVITGALQQHKIGELNDKIELARKESKKLAPQLKRIKKITREREEVDKRLSLITTLDRNRYFRVKLLNDVSFKLPGNCWLTDISEVTRTSFNIDGIAFDNYKIADFMSNLNSSTMVSNVDLKIAEKGKVEKREVMKFRLSADVVPQ